MRPLPEDIAVVGISSPRLMRKSMTNDVGHYGLDKCFWPTGQRLNQLTQLGIKQMISDAIFDAEKGIEEDLARGWYGDKDGPMRRAIEHLLAHMKAVRWLPGLDQWPIAPQLDDVLERVRLAAIARSFGTSSEDAAIAYHDGALDVQVPEITDGSPEDHEDCVAAQEWDDNH